MASSAPSTRVYEKLRSLLLVFLSLAPLTACAAQSENDQSEYLPLRVGNRWVLRSTAVATPIVLEVTGRNNGNYEVRFDNPWVSSVLTFEQAKNRYQLRALTMGGQTATMNGDVYYDFSAREGQTWKNGIGTLTLLSKHKTVQTAHRTFTNCIEIQEVNKQGNKLFWLFAPGVGYVQFGEGPGAFVIDDRESRLPGESAGTGDRDALRAKAPIGAPAAVVSSGRTMLAIAANPAPNESFTPQTVGARFNQALQAGVSYVYLSPKWNELEPHPRDYRFRDLDFQVGEAVQAGLVLICNLRVVDTNQRALPSDLQNRPFNDPQVKERLTAILRALHPRMHGRLRYMLIGNEVDSYFGSHKTEVENYRDLFQAGATTIKSLQPDLPVSLSTAFDGLSQIESHLRPLEQSVDFLALTYYPLHPDFTVRDASAVPGDFDRMIRAAKGRKILLQEVGYPSSTLNNSSEEKQAQTYSAVFQQLKGHRGEFIGANFLFLSNLSESVVNDLAKYYNLDNADRFKAYLRSLGMLDDQGRPKKSWQVFEQEGKSISDSSP